MTHKLENKKLIKIIEDINLKNELIKREVISIHKEYEDKYLENIKLKQELKEKNKEISILKEKNQKLVEKNKEIKQRLDALRNSKLGKITRMIWKVKRGQ